jgi:hypothetical protein
VAGRDLPPGPRAVPAAPWEGADLPPGVYRWSLAALTLLGAVLRIAHIARPFNSLMAWNEGHYAMTALNFDRYGLWSQWNDLGLDHTFSPGVPWLIWGAFRLFGPTEWAARLPIVVSGILAIVLVAALVRRLLRSEQIALVSAGFIAVGSGLVYFSQNVQLDMPSLCCALGGAVLLMRYRDTRRWGEFASAGGCLLLAVWFKFTTALLYPAYLVLWWPARPARPVAAGAVAGAFVGLTALPSVVWVLSGWLSHQITGEFTHRIRDLRWIAKALAEIPLAVEAHLFVLTFVLMLLGIPVLLRRRTEFREIFVWCAPWVILYFLAPLESLTGRYYDLPATYLLVVPAALGLWSWAARGAHGATHTRRLFAAFGIVMALTVAYDLWDPMTDRIAQATIPHPPSIDPVPFSSAKLVARLPRGRTAVDWPQTMFYAGGDPAWVAMVGDSRLAIDGEQFDYIVLNDWSHDEGPYYAVDGPLRERLARHHYVQIAPGAWAHERTAIANLDGRPRPAVPYWSPAPAWRLHGTAAWQ